MPLVVSPWEFHRFPPPSASQAALFMRYPPQGRRGAWLRWQYLSETQVKAEIENMTSSSTKALILGLIQEGIENKRAEFRYLGNGVQYTQRQKEFAFKLIAESGIRATALILNIPRRTLQRWCRKQQIYVHRCPGWVYEWAERRKKRRLFWERRGYC